MAKTLFPILLAAAIWAAACRSEREAPAPGAGCDLSSEAGALDAYQRLSKDPAPRDTFCVKLLPGLESALVGGKAMDMGCDWLHIIHRCRLSRSRTASAEVLGSLGWGEISADERARLALQWVENVPFAREVVLLEKPTGFRSDEFMPPAAVPTGDGGAKVTIWVHRRMRMRTPSKIELHEVLFDAHGAIVADAVRRSL